MPDRNDDENKTHGKLKRMDYGTVEDVQRHVTTELSIKVVVF